MNRSDDPPRSGKNFPRAWMEITEGVNAPKHAYSRSSRTGSSSPVIPSATSPRLSSSPIPRLFSAMKCSSSPSPPSPSRFSRLPPPFFTPWLALFRRSSSSSSSTRFKDRLGRFPRGRRCRTKRTTGARLVNPRICLTGRLIGDCGRDEAR